MTFATNVTPSITLNVDTIAEIARTCRETLVKRGYHTISIKLDISSVSVEIRMFGYNPSADRGGNSYANSTNKSKAWSHEDFKRLKDPIAEIRMQADALLTQFPSRDESLKARGLKLLAESIEALEASNTDDLMVVELRAKLRKITKNAITHIKPIGSDNDIPF